MTNINERILLIIKHFCEGNKAEFARMMEEKPQTINGWLKRENGKKVIDKILGKFSKVNPLWLYTGEGEMLAPQQPEKEKVKVDLSSLMKARHGAENGMQLVSLGEQTQSRQRGMIERIRIAMPEAKNVKPSIIFQHLAETNPSLALWTATGKDDMVVMSRLELEALRGQLVALKMLNESQGKELEAIREKTGAKSELMIGK